MDESHNIYKPDDSGSKVAYFCMEYALTQDMPLYSGGLGILAGDIMKHVHEAKKAIVGLGIFWNMGYVDQSVDEEGSVVDKWLPVDRSLFEEVHLDKPVSVKVDGEDVAIRVLTPKKYKNRVLFIEPAKATQQHFTAKLYQGTSQERLAQEVLLGVGGVRVLRALKGTPEVFHFNEGHAALAGLELIREVRTQKKCSLEDAVEAVKKLCVFTTHTPVAAGNETHPVADVYKICGKSLGFTEKELLWIGGSTQHDEFGMSEAAFRLSKGCNGVSKLHSVTASEMWKHLDRKPSKIIPITNGIHVNTWLNRGADNLKDFDRHQDLVKRHSHAKKLLIEEVLARTKIQLNPDHLLIGFARRAATYKRHTLLFMEDESIVEEKVAAENGSPDDSEIEEKIRKPPAKKRVKVSGHWEKLRDHLEKGTIQILFSGKAHPQDQAGKDSITKLSKFQKAFPKSVVYLPNYDMKLGFLLTTGCDVWLNNPVRPMEASGTSGMKAALNGVINCSISDGWWAEAEDGGKNGWVIDDVELDTGDEDELTADERDSRKLHKVLTEKVVPCFYNDKSQWESMMNESVSTFEKYFTTTRMMDEYEDLLYRQTHKN